MSNVADRVRAHRARQAAGLVLVAFEIDALFWGDLLVRMRLLDPNVADDSKALSAAMRHFVELTAAEEQGNFP